MRYPPGNPTLEDTKQCAIQIIAAYEETHHVKVIDIDEVGNSLGCSPALEFAVGNPTVRKIAAINPLDNLRAQLGREQPEFVWLLEPINNWDNVSLAGKLSPNQELDVISSGKDGRVPLAAKRRISLGNKGHFSIIPGAGHDDPLGIKVGALATNLNRLGFFKP